MENKTTILITLPEQLKEDIHILAIKRKTNMTQLINTILTEYLKENKK